MKFSRSQIGTYVRLILSVVLLAALFSLIDLERFLAHLAQVDIALYLAGLAVYFLFIGLWSARWYYIIQAAGETFSFGRVFFTTLVGNFFAMFLPEVVGSDLARMVEVSEERKASASIVSTVLLDRVVGLVSLMLMALVAFFVGSQFLTDSSVLLVTGGLLVGFVVGWVLFFNRRFMEWWFRRLFQLPLIGRFEGSVRSLYEALFYLHNQPRLLIFSLLLSLLVQSAEVVSIIFLAHALGVQVALSYFFLFLPMVWLLTTLPISIGGLGVREGAFAFFFAQVGVSSEEAVIISLLFYSFRVISGLVGGVVFLRTSTLGYLRSAARQQT